MLTLKNPYEIILLDNICGGFIQIFSTSLRGKPATACTGLLYSAKPLRCQDNSLLSRSTWYSAGSAQRPCNAFTRTEKNEKLFW
jgi:hypothetical protein